MRRLGTGNMTLPASISVVYSVILVTFIIIAVQTTTSAALCSIEDAQNLRLAGTSFSWTGGIAWSQAATNDCCQWSGVQCLADGTTVIGVNMNGFVNNGTLSAAFAEIGSLQVLNLTQCGLTGTIPAALSGLTSLSVLDLSNNGLSGSIPASFFQNQSATTGKGSCWSVQQLLLNGNRLSGTLPQTWNGFCGGSLQILDLSGTSNAVGGIFPFAALSAVLNLQMLSVSGNQFGSTLPVAFPALPALLHLDLSMNQFQGTFPASLTSLPALEYFSISGNLNVTGPIPASLQFPITLQTFDISSTTLTGIIPATLYGLPHLQYLSLSNSAIGGTISTVIGSLRSLVYVGMYNTQISGTIPTQIGNLVSLQSLIMYGTHITGTIPTAIGNMAALSTLSLSDTSIVGPLPTELGRLSLLSSLILDNLNLNATIPTEIGQLGQLTVFSASNAGLYGTIPTEIGNCVNLETLNTPSNYLTGPVGTVLQSSMVSLRSVTVLDNGLSGTIPDSLAPLTLLQRVLVSSNSINGTIPLSFFGLPSLQTLILDNNDLTGSIPSGITTTCSLTFFSVNNNQLSGTIPPSFANCIKLLTVSISVNNVTGPIPTTFGQLTFMESLSLYQNNLTGPIPTQLGGAVSLTSLELYQNRLSGTLPTEFGHLSLLSILTANDNQITGGIPSQMFTLPLTSLSLSNNLLSGPLTLPSFTTFRYLNQLILSGNSFTGSIPAGIGFVSGLSLLDLSRNNFTGSIPSSICALSALSVVRLQHNALTGTFPTCVQISSSLDVSYNQLTGLINFCNMSNGPGVLRLNNNFLSGVHACGPDDPGNSWTTNTLRSIDLSNNMAVFTDGNFIGSYCSSFAGLISFEANILGETPTEEVSVLNSQTLEDCVTSSRRLIFLGLSGHSFMGILPDQLFTIAGPLVINFTSSVFDAAPSNVVRAYSPSTEVEVFGQDSENCRKLNTLGSVDFINLDPNYSRYSFCVCASGYRGSPPHCYSDPNYDVKIAVPVSILIPALIILMGFLYRKLKRRHLMNIANNHLCLYPTGRPDGKAAGGAGAGPSGDQADHYLRMGDDGDSLSPNGGGEGHTTSSLPFLDALSMKLFSDSLVNDLEIPYKDIQILKTIASGASGSVALGSWNKTLVAVKQFHAGMDVDMKDFERESRIHMRLRHPNIVTLFGICRNPVCTVTEFMARGSLFHQLQSSRSGLRGRGRGIALDIAYGMSYLHSRGIMHRDLKSLNVLLDEEFRAKVCDFGTSRESGSARTLTQFVGTVQWMAPETYRGGQYTKACDVYSFGIVLWELVSGIADAYPEMPFSAQVMDHVTSGGRPKLAEGTVVDEGYRSLMERCWDGEETRRPSFEEIVSILEAMSGPDCIGE